MLKRALATALARPLFLCGFRPFFLFGAWFAALDMALWLAFLSGVAPLPAMPGGPFVWHVHELVLGFALAAVVGFLLTSVPEFTSSDEFDAQLTLALLLAWIAARVAVAVSGWIGIVPAAIAQLGLIGLLAARVAPRVLRDPARLHTGFVWALVALWIVSAGFYLDAWRGADAMRWLYAVLGVMMALILLALSRISTRIVNEELDALRDAGNDVGDEYRPAPPRRNLALATIALHALVEWFAPGSAVVGWLALAAAAALLNILGDWHRGRVLLDRWVAMLYAVVVLMALGYAWMGSAILFDLGTVSGGRHLLAAGALSLAIYVAMSIAGRVHTGRKLDMRRWLPAGAAIIVGAALARAAASLGGPLAQALLDAAALMWLAAFANWALHFQRVLAGAREDGADGCAGLAGEHPTVRP